MDRREVLKALAVTSGAALSLPAFTSIFWSCKTESGTTYKPKLFSADQYKCVEAMADTYLPNSPEMLGALALRVPELMDSYTYNTLADSKHENFFKNKKIFLEHLTTKKFDSQPTEKRIEILKAFDDGVIKDGPEKSGFYEIRGMIVNFYFQTEEIAKKHLGYLPVPGKYIPCASVEELGGKKWYID